MFNHEETSAFLLLEVIDINGKILLMQDISNTESYIWNTTKVSDGMYFYRIISNNAIMENGKILIQK